MVNCFIRGSSTEGFILDYYSSKKCPLLTAAWLLYYYNQMLGFVR